MNREFDQIADAPAEHPDHRAADSALHRRDQIGKIDVEIIGDGNPERSDRHF